MTLAISYIEIPNMTNNIDGILAVMKFMYNNIMYAEFNTKSDYCFNCGYQGEVPLLKINGLWQFKCPKCGTTDKSKLDIMRRTCGYLGKDIVHENQGRLADIGNRVIHLGDGTDYHE